MLQLQLSDDHCTGSESIFNSNYSINCRCIVLVALNVTLIRLSLTPARKPDRCSQILKIHMQDAIAHQCVTNYFLYLTIELCKPNIDPQIQGDPSHR